MTYVVKYHKTFLDGILAGLTVDCAVTYPTKRVAEFHGRRLKKRPEGEDVVTGGLWRASKIAVVPLAKTKLAFRARHGIA